MPGTTAVVHVTKLAAAQRQLRAAIKMFFLNEDELAIHTVAAAAYRLLSDLKSDRGRDEVGDFYLTSIFYAIRDYRRGTLPGYLANDPETMAWIRRLAEKLPIGPETRLSDVVASVSRDVARAYWNERNAVPNFLKHADRDVQASISLDDVDNLQLLTIAYGAYVDLVHSPPESEGLMLWLYHAVTHGMVEGIPAPWRDIADKLEALDPAERMQFCSACIRELSVS